MGSQTTYRSRQDKLIANGAMGVQAKGVSPKDREGVPLSAEECVAQIDRLTRSPLFLGSDALCKLLKYLAHHTIHNPTDHLKEYQIATEVFGRRKDFDPQTDSYVRVQLGRLRSKLTSYYETEGAADTVVVEVPKGRHVLSFERSEAPTPAESVSEDDPIPPPVAQADASGDRFHGKRLVLTVMGAVVAVAAVMGGIGLFRAHHVAASAPLGRLIANNQTDMSTMFWAPFIQGPDEPIVVFANANFVGDAETGMRYYEPSRDQHAGITQHYTGVGEVVGVLELDRLLQRHGRQFRVKRSSLFTLDDAHSNNLIFVGSPTENLTLGEVPGTQEFVFHHAETGPDRWRETIINTHPRAGESSVYTPSSVKAHEGDDFAVVALRRGLDTARWTLILAGASTIGTQAAVDYVCDSASVENLLKRLNVSKAADLKPFEALLRVKVIDDVPLSVQLVAIRQTER